MPKRNYIKAIKSIAAPWFYTYLKDEIFRGYVCKHNFEGCKHIMLCVADHFEPCHGKADDFVASSRMDAWKNSYPSMAEKHADADGKSPQHTWFYPPHNDLKHLDILVDLSWKGYGEIEMHLHHNHMPPFPDTYDTLKSKILKCMDDYSRLGIFTLPDGGKTFGFVHGDWSLDNSCGNDICGVNNEISLLRECGCYADFTFPSLGKAQPKMINKIYYALDDPYRPKSYDTGKEIFAGGKAWGDLLMIPGILGIRLKSLLPFPKFSLECSDLDGLYAPSSTRIDYWVRNALTVRGRPDWLFLKLHVHGAVESAWNGQLYQGAHDMFGYFENRYNDGANYKLHYVTARETYNIIKAAESGMSGDPNHFRNFEIPKYTYLQ